MNTYLTEEEQVESIKRWWEKHGNRVLWGLVVIALMFTATKWWFYYQDNIKKQASNQYERLMLAVSENDESLTQSIANTLQQKYGSTIYATTASLLKAKLAIDKKKWSQAEHDLLWVKAHARDGVYKQLATLRLARLNMQQNKNQVALTYLSKLKTGPYASLAMELSGDAHVAEGNKKLAFSAYQKALTMASQKENTYYLEHKLNMLKGSQRSSKTV